MMGSDDSTVRVAVIGLGSMARAGQLPVLAMRDDVEIVGINSLTRRSMELIESQYKIAASYDSLKDLISKARPDAAFVLTPKDTHAEIVTELLQAGIHTFCEKPMATNLDDARQMTELAAEKDRILMIGFNRRYAPVYQQAKQALGPNCPDICVAQKNKPGTGYRATLENMIHMVDIVRSFMGECVEVKAHAQFEDLWYETTAAAMLRFELGGIAFILGNRSCGQWMERVELYGGNRSIVVNCPDDVTITDQEQEHRTSMTPIRMGWATVLEKMGFKGEVDHFIDCVKGGQKPLTDAPDALKSHELTDWILRESGLPSMDETTAP
jgi:virulence factor